MEILTVFNILRIVLCYIKIMNGDSREYCFTHKFISILYLIGWTERLNQKPAPFYDSVSGFFFSLLKLTLTYNSNFTI